MTLRARSAPNPSARGFIAASTARWISCAALARRGRPIIALPATAQLSAEELEQGRQDGIFSVEPVNGEASRIVPILAPGAAVTTSRAHVHYVVTEYGAASLEGCDLAERARASIAISAPQFREPLERAARTLRLLP